MSDNSFLLIFLLFYYLKCQTRFVIIKSIGHTEGA